MDDNRAMELAASSPMDRSRVARRKDPQKSRQANGALLPGVDGRSSWVRRAKEVLNDHLSDIPDASAAERSIIRRAAVLTVELERREAKFANAGEASDSDLDLYQRTAGNLRRLLEAIGLQRRAKQVVDPLPTMEDLRKRYQELGLPMPVIEGDYEDVGSENNS